MAFMSDWIPVPEFENVLIVMADLAETPEGIANSPALPLLEELKSWTGGTVYLFHSPPEAGEVLEDVDPEMAAKFALAAQMSDMPAEAVRDALRRVFSRSVVQRVLVVRSVSGRRRVSGLDDLFTKLAAADLVWAGEWPGEFALGMKAYHAGIFSDLNFADSNLKKAVKEEALREELVLTECELC
jgi:hypothetical protein